MIDLSYKWESMARILAFTSLLHFALKNPLCDKRILGVIEIRL